MANRAEQVRKIQLQAAQKAADLAVKKREAKARNEVYVAETVVHKKRKCNCC